jgi:transposase
MPCCLGGASWGVDRRGVGGDRTVAAQGRNPDGRWRDHRQVLNEILWKLRTGAPWRDVPERYGPWKTRHERLRRWSADGTWERIFARVRVRDDGIPVEWTISVESTVVRAHQHAAGARKKDDMRRDLPSSAHDECVRKERGEVP